MLARSLQLAALLSQHTGYAWSALSAERVSLTLPNGWEHSIWPADTTTGRAIADALRFTRSYAN